PGVPAAGARRGHRLAVARHGRTGPEVEGVARPDPRTRAAGDAVQHDEPSRRPLPELRGRGRIAGGSAPAPHHHATPLRRGRSGKGDRTQAYGPDPHAPAVSHRRRGPDRQLRERGTVRPYHRRGRDGVHIPRTVPRTPLRTRSRAGPEDAPRLDRRPGGVICCRYGRVGWHRLCGRGPHPSSGSGVHDPGNPFQPNRDRMTDERKVNEESLPTEDPTGGDDSESVVVAAEEASEVDALRAELDALTDRHLRLAAEFDNYRKRTER